MLKGIRLPKRNERGFTLIETLVVVILGSIVLGAVVWTIMLTRDSLDKYTSTVATQESASSATALITREVSVSPSFLTAEDYLLEFRNSKDEFIRYVYYDPADPIVDLSANLDGASPQSIPDLRTPALLEMRTYDGTSYSTITVLVDGIDTQQHLRGMPLFTYYNAQNQVMDTPVTVNELQAIERFAVRIVAENENRESDIEIVTSVTPNEGSYAGNISNAEISAPGAPALSGSLPRPNRDATLTWNHVAGANSYTLYREGSAIATFTSDMSLEYVDTGLAWGSTNEYYVIATGPGGSSVQSNTVPLTVVPERPAFINVNPTASGSGSTVARDLTNHLTWTPRDGAEGYRLYRGSTLIYSGTNTRYSDTGRNYGDSTQYTVVAWNTGAYGSGGDSLTSTTVTLISPPTAPTLSGSTNNGSRILNWTAPQYAEEYVLNRTSPSATSWDITSRTYTDSQAISSANFTYRVRASNDAGLGPWSSSVTLQPRPGAINTTVRDYTNNNDGYNEICWTGGSNSTYSEYRKGSGTVTRINSGNCTTDNNPGWDSSHTYQVRPCNMTGCGPWNSDIGRQPPGPFTISSVAQQKRNGSYHNQTTSTDTAVRGGTVTYKWGASSGADSYTAGGTTYSASNRTRTANVTGGSTYNLRVTAVGNTSGLSRNSNTYRFQAAPTMSRNIEMDFQTRGSNPLNTRSRIKGVDLRPVNGTIDRAQASSHYWNGTVWQSRWDWDGKGATWRDGKNVYTNEYQKNWSSASSRRGDAIWTRNYKAIAADHNAGSVTYHTYHDSDMPTGRISSSGTHSYTLWNRLRTGNSNPWDYPGSYSSSWQDVIWTASNKPGIPSNDPNWRFGGR